MDTDMSKNNLKFEEEEMVSMEKKAQVVAANGGYGDVAQLTIDDQDAVVAQDVRKSYGYRDVKLDVLKGVSLAFPKGKICALLGPSGCGKTTLLRLIIGRLKLDSGCIKVFGKVPGTKDCGIPGAKVGYMPQEIALYNEFTIKETMCYFGRIFNMTPENIDKRTRYLLDLLHLPSESSLVGNLSLGQKRRVSFAAALLQNPPLLLLDEPTVGVDPVLRRSIWIHLVELVKNGDTTVIITTHYIEEARQADLVFMMRDGAILTHKNPESLLAIHNCTNLEDVFLKLCNNNMLDKADNQAAGENLTSVTAQNNCESQVTRHPKKSQIRQSNTSTGKCNNCIGTGKVKAVLIKNLLKHWRNLGLLLFQCFIPAIQVIICCLAIGGKPVNLDIGFVNLDQGYHNYKFGDGFIQSLDTQTFSLHSFNDLDVCLDKIKTNELWGVIQIPSNFSRSLSIRMTSCMFGTSDGVIEGSTINIWLDPINQQIFYTLQAEIILTLQKFGKMTLSSLGLKSDAAELPLKFHSLRESFETEPVLSLTDYVSPGLVILVAFYVSAAFIALAFVAEKKNGLLDRSFVAGVTNGEILISHFIIQFVIMLVQSFLAFLFVFLVFHVKCHGSFFWVFLMIVLQGSCGLLYGLIIGILFEEEHVCFMAIITWFFPNIILSGFVWSIQAMPVFLQYFSYALPQTYATETLRAVMIRDLPVTNILVWRGFAVSLIWLAALFICLFIALKFHAKVTSTIKIVLSKIGMKFS